MTINTAGQFLVATPVIAGPPFERAVILMIEHDSTGAVGVIVNLPTNIDVSDVLPDLIVDVIDPPTVYVGGPVSTDSAVVLGRSDVGPFTMMAPGIGIGVIDLDEPPPDTRAIRVYAGYSGWTPGQLEAELEDGSWWVLPATAEEALAPDASGLWKRLVSTAPGAIRFHTHFPPDPSLN